jgi:flagellar hook-basal body complex protein FliE
MDALKASGAVVGYSERVAQNLSRLPEGALKSQSTAPVNQGGITEWAQSVIETVGGGERAALEGMRGTLPTPQIVDAIMKAEQALQTSLAIRDKAVAAYLEVSRMQI